MSVPHQRPHGPRITVVVGDTQDCHDAITHGAREALSQGVPLELRLPHPSRRAVVDGAQRARLARRLDHAVELARSAAPGVDVRVPTDPVGIGR